MHAHHQEQTPPKHTNASHQTSGITGTCCRKKRRTITRLRCAHWQVGACRVVDLQMHQMPQSQSNAPAQRNTIPSRSVLEQVQTGAIFHFTHRRRSQPRSKCEHKPHHTSSVSQSHFKCKPHHTARYMTLQMLAAKSKPHYTTPTRILRPPGLPLQASTIEAE